MDSTSTAGGFRFPAEHFASEYERYAALVLARVPRIGVSALAHVFADWDRRDLLALPDRGTNRNQRRLDPDEIAALTLALREREAALVALGELSAPVFRNAAALAKRLGLTETEGAVLVLAVLGGSMQMLRGPLERLGVHLRDRPAVARAVAALLGLAEAAVLAALDPRRRARAHRAGARGVARRGRAAAAGTARGLRRSCSTSSTQTTRWWAGSPAWRARPG